MFWQNIAAFPLTWKPVRSHSNEKETDQVEHSVGVSCEFGNLSESWIFPHQDLVLRVAVSAHLQKEAILWFNGMHNAVHCEEFLHFKLF